MTQLSPTALEAAAKAMEPKAFETFSRGYTQRNYFENRAFLNAEKVVKRANKKAAAAITAYLAQAEKEGWVMAPMEPTTVQANAGVDADDMRTGFETVRTIYRAMVANGPLAAAQNGGE